MKNVSFFNLKNVQLLEVIFSIYSNRRVFVLCCHWLLIQEPKCYKTYLWECAPSEDSNQTAYSRSLIRIFTGHILDGPRMLSFFVRTANIQIHYEITPIQIY